MSDIPSKVQNAARMGLLRESSAQNIGQLLARSTAPLYAQSIAELVDAGAWEELDDRFFRTLAFGTGGLRGRTIGRTVTNAERGVEAALGRPEFPCVGTNAMNDYNISRATQGLVAYLHAWFAGRTAPGRPMIAGLSAKVRIDVGDGNR